MQIYMLSKYVIAFRLYWMCQNIHSLVKIRNVRYFYIITYLVLVFLGLLISQQTTTCYNNSEKTVYKWLITMGYYPVYKEEANCNMMRNTSRSRNTYLLCFIDFDRIKELCSDFLHGYKMMPQGFHIGMSGLWHICHIKQTMRQWNTYSFYSYIQICSILKISLRLTIRNIRNMFLKIHI